MLLTKRNKVVVFAPTYSRSLGIMYRVNMIVEALKQHFEVRLLTIGGSNEPLLRSLYGAVGSRLLEMRTVWEIIGEVISRRIIAERPDAAVLVTDVSAGAIPILKRSGIPAVLSIEDLSPEWLGRKPTERYFEIMREFCHEADGVIAVSEQLKKRLLREGINSSVSPPGIRKILFHPKDASSRLSSRSILNAGHLRFKEELEALNKACESLGNSFRVWSYCKGSPPGPLARLPNIRWYCYPSLDDAIADFRRRPLGMIVRFRAHCPTRIFLHAALLQPVLAIGDRWVDDVEREGIGIATSPQEAKTAVERLAMDYDRYVSKLMGFAQRNLLENAYSPLIGMLEGSMGASLAHQGGRH